MNAIWKFAIGPGTQILRLPEGAKLLTIQMQHGNPQLWALVNTDPNLPPQDHTILVVGTGYPFSVEKSEYIATFQMEGGMLVWHAFEIPNA